MPTATESEKQVNNFFFKFLTKYVNIVELDDVRDLSLIKQFRHFFAFTRCSIKVEYMTVKLF